MLVSETKVFISILRAGKFNNDMSVCQKAHLLLYCLEIKAIAQLFGKVHMFIV